MMHIDCGKDWKPGDQPPPDHAYNDRHEWAEVQHKAGLRQGLCVHCGKWLFPQEECGHDKSARLNKKQWEQSVKDSEKQFKEWQREEARRILRRKK